MPRKNPPGKKLPAHRPKIEIEWKKVDTMMFANCSGTEIAGALGICYDTFLDRFRIEYGVSFSQQKPKSKEGGHALLKARQFSSAMNGNSTMLKLLGEEWLGQGKKNNDNIEIQVDNVIDAVREVKAEQGSSSAVRSFVEDEQSVLDQGQRGEEGKVQSELGATPTLE